MWNECMCIKIITLQPIDRGTLQLALWPRPQAPPLARHFEASLINVRHRGRGGQPQPPPRTGPHPRGSGPSAGAGAGPAGTGPRQVLEPVAKPAPEYLNKPSSSEITKSSQPFVYNKSFMLR